MTFASCCCCCGSMHSPRVTDLTTEHQHYMIWHKSCLARECFARHIIQTFVLCLSMFMCKGDQGVGLQGQPTNVTSHLQAKSFATICKNLPMQDTTGQMIARRAMIPDTACYTILLRDRHMPVPYLYLNWEQTSMLDIHIHCTIGRRDSSLVTRCRRLSSALVD